MKNIIYIIILFIAILSSTSCDKIIEFDEDLIRPKLVVNGFVIADSLIDVKIASSKPIPGIEQNFKWIDNATVTLYVDGEKAEELETYPIEYPEQEEDNYYWYNQDDTKPTVGYKSKTKAEIGKTYKLTIEHPDYETASCETTVPEMAPVLEFSSSPGKTNMWSGEEVDAEVVKFRFKDLPDDMNYYRLYVTFSKGVFTPNDYGDPDDTTGYIRIENNVLSGIIDDDPKLSPDQDDANDYLFGSPSNSYNLFTDEFIKDEEYQIEFSFIPHDLRWINGVFDTPESKEGEFYRMHVYVQTLTRDAYYYLKASRAQRYYDGDLFSEPVQAYSNIENGIGIFAAFSSNGFEIAKGEYPIEGFEYEEGYRY